MFRLGLIKMRPENQILNSLELDVCKGQRLTLVSLAISRSWGGGWGGGGLDEILIFPFFLKNEECTRHGGNKI